MNQKIEQAITLNKPNDNFRTAKQLGISLFSKEQLKNLCVTYEIVNVDNLKGELQVKVFVQKNKKFFSKIILIKNYKSQSLQNQENIESFLNQLQTNYATVYDYFFAPWKVGDLVESIYLGIDLPLNLKNLEIKYEVLENDQINGIVTLNVSVAQNSLVKTKSIKVNNFMKYNQYITNKMQQILLSIKRQLITSHKNKRPSHFVLGLTSLEKLGVQISIDNLPDIKITYEIFNINNIDGQVSVYFKLTNNNITYKQIIIITGFLTTKQWAQNNLQAIANYLAKYSQTSPFDLKKELQSESAWNNLLAILKTDLKQKFSDEIINFLTFKFSNNLAIHGNIETNKFQSFLIDMMNLQIDLPIVIYFKNLKTDQDVVSDFATVFKLKYNNKMIKNKQFQLFSAKNFRAYIKSENPIETISFLFLKQLTNVYLPLVSGVELIIRIGDDSSSENSITFLVDFFKGSVVKKNLFFKIKGFLRQV